MLEEKKRCIYFKVVYSRQNNKKIFEFINIKNPLMDSKDCCSYKNTSLEKVEINN